MCYAPGHVRKCLHYEGSQNVGNRVTAYIKTQLISHLNTIHYPYFNSVICYLKDIKYGIFLYVHVHHFLFSSASFLNNSLTEVLPILWSSICDWEHL